MDMVNSLACIGTAIGNHTVAVFIQALFVSNLGYCHIDICNKLCIFGSHIVQMGDVILGNKQIMNGSSGSDILKGVYCFVLVYLLRGDLALYYFAEQAIVIKHLNHRTFTL